MYIRKKLKGENYEENFKCNNINKYNKYIIKNTFGLDDDIL